MGGSNLAIRKLLDGTMPFSAKFGIDLVDVEDVAEMYVEAMINNDAMERGFYYHLKQCGIQKFLKFYELMVLKKSRFSAPNLQLDYLQNLRRSAIDFG